MMRRLGGAVVTVGLVVGAGYLLYTYGLSESAKTSLRTTINTVKDACEQVCTLVSKVEGHEENGGPLPNQQRTAAQWEALGL